jgi:hypothetical protein
MTKPELDQLERDVENARQRVSLDVQRLQSSTTLSAFKDEIRSEVREYRTELVDRATAYRDELVDRATNAVKDRAQGFVTEVKDRAAANPLAALAIGAGLVWRFIHKPPIATLLVGGGLIGLLKTDPQHPALGADLVPQAADWAVAAKDQAEQLTSDASEMVAVAQTKVAEWVDNAGDALARAAVASEPVKEALQTWGIDAGDAVSEFTTMAKSLVEQGSQTLKRIAQAPEERDKYLLGAAAVALIAAVGIASQRHTSDEVTPGLNAPRAGGSAPNVLTLIE